MADVGTWPDPDDANMKLTIDIEEREPPVGRVILNDGTDSAPVVFTGWLGLVAALSELLDATDRRSS